MSGRAAERPVVRLQSLTSLRFFAALLVVFIHAGSLLSASKIAHLFFGYGYTGVSFFFVLSGFVLTWSYSSRRSAGRFYWLRFSRIWPLHAVTLLYAGLWISQSWVPSPAGVGAIVLGLQAFVPVPKVFYGLNGVSWSLSCEAFFYLLFPFVVPLLMRQRGRRLLAVAAAIPVLLVAAPAVVYAVSPSNGWVQQHTEWLFFVNPGYRFGEFLTGVLAALAVTRGWRPRVPVGVVVAGIALTFAVFVRLGLSDGIRVPRPYAAAILLPGFAALIVAAASRELSGHSHLLRARPLVFLGESSFALYLVHQLVLRTVNWRHLSPSLHGPSVALFGSFLAVALVVAATLHLLVERPVERVLRRMPVGAARRPTRSRRAVTNPVVLPQPVDDNAQAG
jgi:peptidoglycan/LPS O-acetylase OafA/YrhL